MLEIFDNHFLVLLILFLRFRSGDFRWMDVQELDFVGANSSGKRCDGSDPQTFTPGHGAAHRDLGRLTAKHSQITDPMIFSH